MTQKQALDSVLEFCKTNGFALERGDARFGKVFALYEAAVENVGKITGTQPDGRISRFYTPKELDVFIEGYLAGIQAATNSNRRDE